MTEEVQMKSVPELRFPMLNCFSPLATSSPKLTKMRTPKHNHSPNRSWTSTSDESSGNLTFQAINGVDESHLDVSKPVSGDLSVSMHTAIEYVDPKFLQQRNVLKTISRNDLRKAIVERKKATNADIPDEDAHLYAIVVAERIIWTARRTWTGTVPVAKEGDLSIYAEYACEDWYMKNTASLCIEELKHISEWDNFDWNCVATYCYGKGMPLAIIKRIFTKNLVRRSTGESLDVIEMLWLLFAMIGTDEPQSFEYWFRVLDVYSTGVLVESHLQVFYTGISNYLADRNVTSLPFENVMAQFSDILGTTQWTLQSMKKNIDLAGRVINGFVNAYRFLEQEMDEKTNADRVDDDNFGEGRRTRWQRMIDHEFDDFYRPTSSAESSTSSV